MNDKTNLFTTKTPYVIVKMLSGLALQQSILEDGREGYSGIARQKKIKQLVLEKAPWFPGFYNPEDHAGSSMEFILIHRAIVCCGKELGLEGKRELHRFQNNKEWATLWNYITICHKQNLEVDLDIVRKILRHGILESARGLTGVYILRNKLDPSIIRIGIGGTGKKDDIVDRIKQHGPTWEIDTIFVNGGGEAAENLEKEVKDLGQKELGMIPYSGLDNDIAPYVKPKRGSYQDSCWEQLPGYGVDDLSDMIFEKRPNLFKQRLRPDII